MTVMMLNKRSCQSRSDCGWSASLELEIAKRDAKSVVCSSRQQGPLTIQRPFYPEKGVCHLYLLHPPAGIVGGDQLQLKIETKAGGEALLTTPGATKFYRSNGRTAHQWQDFLVGDGTSLEWLPQETIYFPEAEARVRTRVRLQGSSRFIGWDIHCLGLPVNRQDLGNGRVGVGLQLYRDEIPLLLEAMTMARDKQPYQAAFWQHQPVCGSFLATGADRSLLEKLRQTIGPESSGRWGATLIEDLLVIRYLGPSVLEARALFVSAWQQLRPALLGRKAVPPRIWTT